MALSHVVMHLALCSAASRLTQPTVPVRIAVTDKIGRPMNDQIVHVARTGAADATAEFDIAWGYYLARASMHVGKVTCSGNMYFPVIADHNRELHMQLQNGMLMVPRPTIIYGDLPGEFAYVSPTVVVFGKDTKCDGSVGTPIDTKIDQQNDEQAYYATVYPTAELMRNAPFTLALRLTDSSGGYHYLRMPANFLGDVPSLDELDVKDALIDFIAAKPEDTLLCPRGYETIVH